MDKRKIKRPSVLKTEAELLLALSADKGTPEEPPLEELQEAAEALKRDMLHLPMTGFSYKELYVILRFLVELNRQDEEATIAHFVRDKDEELLCGILAAGIVQELDEYAVCGMFQIFEKKGIDLEEVFRR